ncbi:MAG: hypothetical protein RJB66_2025 [Pseudomonadota bacterium]|jgi:hypothetical protein
MNYAIITSVSVELFYSGATLEVQEFSAPHLGGAKRDPRDRVEGEVHESTKNDGYSAFTNSCFFAYHLLASTACVIQVK